MQTPGGTIGTECGPTCASGAGVGTATIQRGQYEKTTTHESDKVVRKGEEAVCGQEHYTKVEDRPRVIERKEYIKEHHPVEKEFIVETRFVGEKELQEGRDVEVLGSQEREIKTTAPKSPCE